MIIIKFTPTLRDAFPKEFIDRFNNTMATKQHPNGILTDDVVKLTDDGFYMYIDVAKVYNRMGFPARNMTNIEIGEDYVYEDAFNTKEIRVRIKDPILRMKIESQVIKFT